MNLKKIEEVCLKQCFISIVCDVIDHNELNIGIKKKDFKYTLKNFRSRQIIPLVVVAVLILIALVPIIVFIIKTQNSMVSLKEDVEKLKFYWLDLKGKMGMYVQISGRNMYKHREKLQILIRFKFWSVI